jgi:hypothetical protein
VREITASVDAWAPSQDGRGVGEERRALSTVVPAAVVLRELGPRPASAALQHVWQSGAATIEDYRQRWGVSDPRSTLGVDGSPSSLASLPPRRLADHLEVVRSLDRVSRTLGRDVAMRSHDRGLGLGLG